MNALAPLETLYAVKRGNALALPPELARLYGPLQLPARGERARVISNFVTTLDGVVSLGMPGHAGGSEISGANPHDRMVMGLLRAMADAVIVGAGTLRASPHHLWTAEYIYPALADAYRQLRQTLHKAEQPLNVIVTARGEIDARLPVFQTERVPTLIVASAEGAARIAAAGLPSQVQLVKTRSHQRVSAGELVKLVEGALGQPGEVILVEGGPQLMGDFFAEGMIDEQFLTLAPQIAGRDASGNRPGLVAGKIFAPTFPIWSTLLSVKRGGDHLFLRYAFERNRKS